MNGPICLIGFGEVGRTLADDLSPKKFTLSAWDTQFHDAESAPAKAAAIRDVRCGQSASDAADGAALVISAVTAAQTLAAARDIARAFAPNAYVLDLNSAAPQTKVEAAEIINAASARYVEAAVMSPIAPKGVATPILLGGPHAAAFLPHAQALGFANASAFSAHYGQAAAAKLCRSIIVKGMEALLMESMLAARHYGVEAAVLASLSDLFPGPDWERHARYMISRAIEHGVRRAEEMREAAHTVADAGLAPLMSAACAERQDWAARFRDALACQDLPSLLDRVRAEMQA